MAGISDDRLSELYQLASKEQDSKKLMGLVAEINRALDERRVAKALARPDRESDSPPQKSKTA
jgi:hypothetical protein